MRDNLSDDCEFYEYDDDDTIDLRVLAVLAIFVVAFWYGVVSAIWFAFS